LRGLYKSLELPGANPLKDAQKALDNAVRAAYGMNASADPLSFLLALNLSVYDAEQKGQPVQGPGVPLSVKNPTSLVTADCITL
jgi:hypothetical protein